MELLKYLEGIYSKQNKDKPRDNCKHLIYYILL